MKKPLTLLTALWVSLGFALKDSCNGQETAADRVVVSDEEISSAYGAPPGFSRNRFSPLIDAYVLPPGVLFTDIIYEGDAFRHGPPDHTLTEEIELGLPYRLGAAFEISQERFNGDFQNKSFSIETRYALANWNNLPLNPTLFAEYKFGTGLILHDEDRPPKDEDGGGRAARSRVSAAEDIDLAERPRMPDACELRLLLAKNVGEHLEWAMNVFFEQEIGGDRDREWGFAQSAVTPALLPNEQLTVGVEMQYRNATDKDTRGDPVHSFVIGPRPCL